MVRFKGVHTPFPSLIVVFVLMTLVLGGDGSSAGNEDTADLSTDVVLEGGGHETTYVYRLGTTGSTTSDYSIDVRYRDAADELDLTFAIMVPVDSISGATDLWQPSERIEEWVYLYSHGTKPHTQVGVTTQNESFLIRPEEGEGAMRPLSFPSASNGYVLLEDGEYLFAVGSSTEFTFSANFSNLTILEGPIQVGEQFKTLSISQGDHEGTSAHATIQRLSLASAASDAHVTLDTSSPGFFFIQVITGFHHGGGVKLIAPDGHEPELQKKWRRQSGVGVSGVFVGAEGAIHQADLLVEMQGTWRVVIDPVVGTDYEIVVGWMPFGNHVGSPSHIDRSNL